MQVYESVVKGTFSWILNLVSIQKNDMDPKILLASLLLHTSKTSYVLVIWTLIM